MSKFLGWLGGSLIAFGIAYTLLPLGYEMIISWFGPVLGYSLRPIIAAFYNLFGDYSDVIHITIWTSACFIGGLIATRGKGGIVVGFSIFSTMFLLMIAFGLIVLSTFVNFSTWQVNPTVMSQLQSLAMSPPPGIDIFAIFSIPVIGDLMDFIINAMLMGGGILDLSMLISLIINVVAVRLVINLVIAMVLGGIGGYISRKIINMRAAKVKDTYEVDEIIVEESPAEESKWEEVPSAKLISFSDSNSSKG
ncbi:MAG: hypothetical protein ACFE7E_00055 [Candidatus Hodarchaeota archaeon]